MAGYFKNLLWVLLGVFVICIAVAVIPTLAVLGADFVMHILHLIDIGSRIAANPHDGLSAVIALFLIAGLVGWIISMLRKGK